MTPSKVRPTQRGNSTVSRAGISLPCHRRRQRCRSGRARAAPRSAPSVLWSGEPRAAPDDLSFPRRRRHGFRRDPGAVGGGRRRDNPYAYLRAVASLCGVRLLVPIVATAKGLAGTEGRLAADKEAEMAVVLLQRQRRSTSACSAFTAWTRSRSGRNGARPVPVTLDVAAKTALAEGAAARDRPRRSRTLAIEGALLTSWPPGTGWSRPSPTFSAGRSRPPPPSLRRLADRPR